MLVSNACNFILLDTTSLSQKVLESSRKLYVQHNKDYVGDMIVFLFLHILLSSK